MSICLSLLLTFLAGRAQVDTSFFSRIAAEMKSYTPDTSAVPQDRFTRKIMELRRLRGGFNIEEAMRFAVAEEAQKNPGNTESVYLNQQFNSGQGAQWLSNATIWVYRRNFTYREVKKLVKFYRSPAGQKFAATQPLTMMETAAAAAMIKEELLKRKKS